MIFSKVISRSTNKWAALEIIHYWSEVSRVMREHPQCCISLIASANGSLIKPLNGSVVLLLMRWLCLGLLKTVYALRPIIQFYLCFIAHHFPHVLLLVSLFPVPFLLSHSSFSPRYFMCSSESYNFHYIFVLPSFNLRLRNISDFQWCQFKMGFKQTHFI